MHTKPTLLQNLGTKILVLALCAISFVAGMYAYQSRQIHACTAMGGQMIAKQNVMLCQHTAPF